MSDSVPEFGRLAPAEVSAAVIEQYDDHAQPLLQGHHGCVAAQRPPPSPTHSKPGGGSHDIHYGIFRSETDGVREASNNSTDFMLSCMDWARPVRGNARVQAATIRSPASSRRRRRTADASSCGRSRLTAWCWTLVPATAAQHTRW